MKFKMYTTLSDRPSGIRHRRPETSNPFFPFPICAKAHIPTANMEEKMSNSKKISRNQNQHDHSSGSIIEDQKLQIFSSLLPEKEVGTPGIMTRLSRVLFPEPDVVEGPMSLEDHVSRLPRVSMGDRTTAKLQSQVCDSLAMLGSPSVLGSELACVSIKLSKRSTSKSMSSSSRNKRGGKKEKRQAKAGEVKSRERRGNETSSCTENRNNRRGRSLDSSATRRQSLAYITNNCDVSAKKRKSRRRKSESSRRVSGMDILGNLESLHDIVNQQANRVNALSRKQKKKSKSKAKKYRKRSGNSSKDICNYKSSSAKENLNPKSKGVLPTRRALSTVTSTFENLPSANNNISSMVTPLVPDPCSPLAKTRSEVKSDVKKNHNTLLKSPSILKDKNSSASVYENAVAVSTDEIPASPTITNSDTNKSIAAIYRFPSTSETMNPAIKDGNSLILADETAVGFNNDEELMSPTIAPRASKRADMKATPIHMKNLNEKENIEPQPSSNHAANQKIVNSALLSPSDRPRSAKRIDMKKTPTQAHVHKDTGEIIITKDKDETSIAILKEDSKISDVENEASTKADTDDLNYVVNTKIFMSPSTPFKESIDCHSCPKEIFVDLSKVQQDFDLKDGIVDLTNSPPQPNIIEDKRVEKESATKSVIRRSSRKQHPVNRFVASFKRKRKRGVKRVEKGESTKKTEILYKGNTASYKSPGLKNTQKKESMEESTVVEPKSEATRRSSRSHRPVDRLSLSFKKQRNKKKVKQIEEKVSGHSINMAAVKESTSFNDQACNQGVLLKSSRISKPPERLTYMRRKRKPKKNAVIKQKTIKSEEIKRAENAKENNEPKISELKICVKDEDSTKRRSSRRSKSVVRFQPNFSNTHSRTKKNKKMRKTRDGSEKREKLKEKEHGVIKPGENVLTDEKQSEEKRIGSTIPEENYIGLLTQGKRFEDKCFDSSEKNTGWNSASIRKLKIAHAEVEPTSHLFWHTIAQKVPGKTAEDCHHKWFAMFASPVRQKKADKNISEVTDALDINASDDASVTDDEDDIFDSTPVRNGSQLFLALLGSSAPTSLRKSSAQSPTKFSDMFSSPLLLKKKSCRKEIVDIDGASPLTLRNQSKLYMKELKAGIGEKMKAFEPKKKSFQKKKNNDILESIEDGDTHLGGALSPGGTLRIEGLDDDDLEQMYCDSDVSISSEMG